jgi:hypothetical protein
LTFWRLHDKFFRTETGNLVVTGTDVGGVITNGTTLDIPKDVLFLGDSTAILKVLYVIETGDTIGFGAADKAALRTNYGEYVQKYVNGVCYYRLNIRQGGTALGAANVDYVLRNNLYQAAITKFMELGSPSLEDLDDGSGNQDTSPTYVTAEFHVLEWVDAASSSEVPPWEP